MSIAYQSNAVPSGGLLIEVYRFDTPPGSNPAKLGDYNLESLSPTVESIEVNRPNIYGGETSAADGSGWAISEGPTKGSAVIQLASTASPTLAVGDYFAASIRVDKNGQAISERFVITSVGHSVAMTDYRKQSVNVRVDKHA
jgi:hypothetical protein